MDERTQRRLRRETVRDIDYAKFIKEQTRNKNITARENRMLRRRVLRDEYMKNEELKKKNTKRNQQEEEKEFMISIPISDIRKILQAKRETHKAIKRGMALGEINYQMWKIQKICEKYVK